MNMRLYCIYDTKAENAGTLVPCNTDAEARRQFGILVADKGTIYGRHPEDFILCYVGDWDSANMILTPAVGATIAKGIEFIKENN